MAQEIIDFGKDAILIARVSTEEQVLVEDASPQIKDLLDYATKLGYTRFKQINSVESGFLITDKKIGWNLVTDFIKENPSYRTIIVTEMSRLSRLEEVLHGIKNYLIEHQIQLLIKDIDFSLLNHYGIADEGKSLIFALYASLANSEMRQKKERFKRALKDYRERGYSIGGKELFGYSRIVDGGLKDKKTYVIDDDEAKLVYQVFYWYAYGINNDLSSTSASTIALKCKAEGFPKHLHSKRNILKMLKDTAYIGHKTTHNRRKNPDYWQYKKKDAPKYIECESFECKYPQIIQDGLFDLVQKRLTMESTHTTIEGGIQRDKSSKHTTILAKIIRCKHCGFSFLPDYRFKNGKPVFTYRDGGARGKIGLRKCEYSQTLSMRMLDSAVWSFIKEMVTDITSKQEQKKSSINIEKLHAQIDNLNQSKEELEKKYDAESYVFKQKMMRIKDVNKVKKEYDNALEQIDKERAIIDVEIEKISRQLLFLNNASSHRLDRIIKDNINFIENSKADMNKYVHLLIKEIIPLCNMKNYNVLQITAVNNYDDVLDYSNTDATGLPNIVAKKHDGLYYLIIEKDFRSNYRTRAVVDNMAYWNDEQKAFFLSHDPQTLYTVEEIMNHTFDVSVNRRDISLGICIEELDFKLLDFYKEDFPNS